MKQRSSESHPSLLEDGRVATEFERISNNGAARAIRAFSKMAESRRSSKEFQIRTVVNAVLGECIWNLSYNERRMAIELELTTYLEEEDADALINQFPVPGGQRRFALGGQTRSVFPDNAVPDTLNGSSGQVERVTRTSCPGHPDGVSGPSGQSVRTPFGQVVRPPFGQANSV